MNAALRIETQEVFHEPLSAAQEKMLKTIMCLRDKNGLFPTYGEIAEELGITGQSVYDSVRILVKKGYLRRKQPRKSRSLEIVFDPFNENVTLK
jgi:DNA-binding MarR family transcriptional regulator